MAAVLFILHLVFPILLCWSYHTLFPRASLAIYLGIPFPFPTFVAIYTLLTNSVREFLSDFATALNTVSIGISTSCLRKCLRHSHVVQLYAPWRHGYCAGISPAGGLSLCAASRQPLRAFLFRPPLHLLSAPPVALRFAASPFAEASIRHPPRRRSLLALRRSPLLSLSALPAASRFAMSPSARVPPRCPSLCHPLLPVCVCVCVYLNPFIFYNLCSIYPVCAPHNVNVIRA